MLWKEKIYLIAKVHLFSFDFLRKEACTCVQELGNWEGGEVIPSSPKDSSVFIMKEVHAYSKILKYVIILKPSSAPEGVRMKRRIFFFFFK